MSNNSSSRVPLLLAAVGIAGTLLGGTLQHYFALGRDRAKAIEEQRSQAFVDFLNALDKARMATTLRSSGDKVKAQELQTEFEVKGGGALRRIGIFAEKEVVEAVATWSRTVSLPECGPQWMKDLKVWETMRQSLLGSAQRVSERDLGELTLFCRPST